MKRKIFYIAALLLINGLSFSKTEIPDEELYKIIKTELMYKNFETAEEAFTEAKKIYLSRNNLPLSEDKESFIPVLNEEIKYEAPKSSKVTYGLSFEGGFRYLTDKFFSKGRVEEWKRENPLGYDKDKTDTDIPDYSDKLLSKDFEFSDLSHIETSLPGIQDNLPVIEIPSIGFSKDFVLPELSNTEITLFNLDIDSLETGSDKAKDISYSLSSNDRIDTPIVKNKGYFSLKNTGTTFTINGIDGSKGSKGDAADNKGGDGDDGGNGGNAFEVSGGYLVPGNNFSTVIVTAGKGGDGGNGGGGGSGQEGGQGGGGQGVPIDAGDGGDGGNGGRGGNAIGATITSHTNLFGKVIAIGGEGGSAGSGGGGGWHPTSSDGDDGDDGTFGSGGNAVGINSTNKTFNNYGRVVATGGKNGAGHISGTGIGIQGNSNNIDNSGVILGSTNAIMGNNNNINNLGILGTFNGSNIISGSGNNVKNLGITISYNEDGTVKNVTSSSSGATVTVNGKSYTSMSVNGVSGNQSNKVINATNSNRYLTTNSDIKFNNVVINGAHNSKGSLNVTGGTTEINNSQINSLFTAAEVAIGTLIATNTVFNGSGDIVDINNNGKVVIADESVVLGDINMSDGNNSLVLSNSYFDGVIKTGAGSNDITLDQIKYEGTLDLSEGNDNITISNGTQLDGFTLGSGHNTVTVDNAEYLKHIDLSQGNDSLWLQNGGTINSVTFGNGNNIFGILNTKYTKDIDLKNGNNEANFNNAILEGKLTAGSGNDKLDMINGLIKGNVSLGNGSNQAILTDSGIQGNLITGSGNDSLKLNDSVIDGTVNLGNGNNTINIQGEGAGITGTLTTGNGDDTLISNGGVIGNNVDLTGGTNSIDLTNGGIIGNLTSLITSKLKMIAAVIQGNVNLGAGDKDINLSANSGILGTLVAGNDNDNLNMNTSIIEGDVDLAEGENSLNLDNSLIEGTVITGNDNDTLNLVNSVTGGVDLENGNNQITLTDSGINGSLSTGSGADNLQINNSVISGNTNLGDGSNTINIQGEGAGITGTLTAGSGNDILISNGGVIGDNVDLTGGTNSIDLSNGGIIGGLTSLITSKLKMVSAVIQGNVDLGAGDKDINLSANSGILGNLSAGNDNDNLNMNTSIIEGDIDLAEGENSLNLDNSLIEGTVITGNDNDTLNLINSVTGGVDLKNGNNQITLTDSGINGSLSTGSGADNLQVNNSVITGNTNLGDGNNTINIQGDGAGITGTLTTGSGNDTLISSGGVIGNNVDLAGGTNFIDLSNGGIIGDLTSIITSKLKIESAVIQGNADLGAGEKDINLSANSGILGNLTAGNDKDNLTMDTSIIEGNVDLAEGENSLNLDNSVIEGTVTTGNDSDTLNLVNSITGGVALGNGNNQISLVDSGTKGNLTTGSGNDNLVLNDSIIDGNTNLGNGNNIISIQGGGAGITGTLTTGSGNDILISNGGVIGDNVNLAGGTNSIDLSNGGIIGDLTSIITSKLKMITAVIQGNVDLGSGDKSINLSSNSGILGNLTAGNDKDNLTMDTSIIKGNVNLAEGENTLILDNSIIEGTVTAGNDNDTFNLVNSVAGGVNLGSGDNRINLTDSGIKGSLNTGSGADNLQVNGSIIEGNTNLGDGNNTINVQGEGAGITGTLTTGSGDDTLISNGGVIGNTVNLGRGVNFIDLTNGGIIGDLTSLITSKLKMTTAVIQGNVNLGSGDKDINLSANSGILGNLVAGNGKDNLSMNDSLIKGNVSLAEGENSLNLRNSVIKGTITTGKDNDMLNLTDSLTGRVNLGEGQNKINFSYSGIKGDLTTGSGADNLLMKNSIIDGEVNLGDGGNVISMNDSHIDNLITGTGNDQVSLHFIPRETYTQSNVKIDLGDGDNSLIVGEMIALTGRVQGGKDNDFMSTEGDTKLDLVLNDFEDLTLKGKTFLSSTSKLNSKEISFDKELYLDIDESKKDSIGRYIGHGLYDTGSHLGTMEGEFVVNSTETNFMERVTFGDTDLTDISEGVRSDSIIHQAKLDKNGDVVIVTDNALDIPDIEGIPGAGLEGSHIRYEELNKVYQSIYNAGKVHYLAGDVTLTDKDNWQAFGNLLSLLNQIYGNTIYGHSQKLSIDTLESFTEGVRNNFYTPYEGEWNVQGIALGNSSYRKNRHIGAEYYGFDNGSEAYTIKSHFTGLIGLVNYGVTDNLTTGVAFGGGKQWSDFTKDSRLDGDSFYLGLHSKYEDNFYNTPHKYSVTIGTGIQRNLYKGRRTVITNFTDTHNTENFSTTSLNGYLEGKVEYELTDRLTLTPGYIFNISSARQDSISEAYTESALALETDKSIQTIYSNTFSLELSKYFDYKEWDYNIYGKISYTRNSGDVSHSLNSRIKGSPSDFTILGSETGRNEGSFEVGIRGTKDSFNYSLSSYTTRGSHHEREYGIKVSFSYMFNKVEDFIPIKIEEPRKVTEVLSGFELNSSELTSEMEKSLERMTSKVTEGVIKITGHTDNTGTDKINEKLSMERAEAAKKKMSETIDNTRIETTGKGSKEPLTSNSTPEGQARNRRVEIEIPLY